jgi:hypothetical protein
MKVIVFGMRGCSAGWLGAYGNEWIATPNLDRLAAEGIVFDRHISNCPDHAAACRAWLNGQANPGQLFKGMGLLASLRADGILTVLVRANHPDTDAPDWFYADWVEVFDARPQEEDRFSLDSLIRSLPSLLDRLANIPNFLLWFDLDSLLPPWTVRQDVFEAYVEDEEEEPDYPLESESEVDEDEAEVEEEDGGEVQDVSDEDEMKEDDEVEEEEALDPEVAEQIEAGTMEPVTPWADPPTGLFDGTDADAREWLHWSLAAVVTGLDAELGVVFEQLRSRGLDRTAAWLLTSDFGYPLGEHGQIGRYRPWLYEELVHLPLILRFPNAEEACRRVATFTQPQDIAPTLLDLYGIAQLAGTTVGVSLLPIARGADSTGREYAITKLEIGSATEFAIRTNDWAYLLPTKLPPGETREAQLFGKPHDRWEVDDLRARNIEQSDELDERLRKFIAQNGE